jgi:hypothetical protein
MVPLSLVATASLSHDEIPSSSTLLNVLRNLGGAFGIAIHPDMVPHIVTAVMAINGLINVWRKETQAPKPEIVP